jgi:hypothetical protein
MPWVTVAEAPAYAAPAAHVAAALGLQINEVTAGPRSWTYGQHQHADMFTAARLAERVSGPSSWGRAEQPERCVAERAR